MSAFARTIHRYDLRQDVMPDQLFLDLLVAGKSPEDLAMTLKLDAAMLYQEGIRTLIERGDETAARVLPLICSEHNKIQIEHNDVVPLLAETGQVCAPSARHLFAAICPRNRVVVLVCDCVAACLSLCVWCCN